MRCKFSLARLTRADDPLYTWESGRGIPFSPFPNNSIYYWRDVFAWHLNNTGQTNRYWSSSTSVFPGGVGTVSPINDYGSYDINVLPLWAISDTSTNVVIAIIDTGMDDDHEDLDDIRVNLVSGVTFWNGNMTSVYNDTHGHGTGIAGIIGADWDDVGSRGIVRGAKYIIVKGTASRSLEDFRLGLQWAIDHGANIVSISNAYGDSCADIYKANPDILFVQASDNGIGSTVKTPCVESSNAISVGGLTRDGRYDLGGVCEIYAPEGWVCVASINPAAGRRYTYSSGCSLASPMVAGVAALLWKWCPNAIAVKTALMDGRSFNGAIGRIDAMGAYNHRPTKYELIVTEVELNNPIEDWPWQLQTKEGGRWAPFLNPGYFTSGSIKRGFVVATQ
jgi:subtilisin family serine protease